MKKIKDFKTFYSNNNSNDLKSNISNLKLSLRKKKINNYLSSIREISSNIKDNFEFKVELQPEFKNIIENYFKQYDIYINKGNDNNNEDFIQKRNKFIYDIFQLLKNNLKNENNLYYILELVNNILQKSCDIFDVKDFQNLFLNNFSILFSLYHYILKSSILRTYILIFYCYVSYNNSGILQNFLATELFFSLIQLPHIYEGYELYIFITFCCNFSDISFGNSNVTELRLLNICSDIIIKANDILKDKHGKNIIKNTAKLISKLSEYFDNESFEIIRKNDIIKSLMNLYIYYKQDNDYICYVLITIGSINYIFNEYLDAADIADFFIILLKNEYNYISEYNISIILWAIYNFILDQKGNEIFVNKGIISSLINLNESTCNTSILKESSDIIYVLLKLSKDNQFERLVIQDNALKIFVRTISCFITLNIQIKYFDLYLQILTQIYDMIHQKKNEPDQSHYMLIKKTLISLNFFNIFDQFTIKIYMFQNNSLNKDNQELIENIGSMCEKIMQECSEVFI